jgi:hypothetical protein
MLNIDLTDYHYERGMAMKAPRIPVGRSGAHRNGVT